MLRVLCLCCFFVLPMSATTTDFHGASMTTNSMVNKFTTNVHKRFQPPPVLTSKKGQRLHDSREIPRRAAMPITTATASVTTTTSILADVLTLGVAAVGMAVAVLMAALAVAAVAVNAAALFGRRKRRTGKRWPEQGCKERKMKLVVMLSYLMDLVRSVPVSSIQSAVDDWIAGGNAKENVKATYGEIKDWDTSEITNMDDLFSEQSNFNGDVSAWDVSKVETMAGSTFDSTSTNPLSPSLQYRFYVLIFFPCASSLPPPHPSLLLSSLPFSSSSLCSI